MEIGVQNTHRQTEMKKKKKKRKQKKKTPTNDGTMQTNATTKTL